MDRREPDQFEAVRREPVEGELHIGDDAGREEPLGDGDALQRRRAEVRLDARPDLQPLFERRVHQGVLGFELFEFVDLEPVRFGAPVLAHFFQDVEPADVVPGFARLQPDGFGEIGDRFLVLAVRFEIVGAAVVGIGVRPQAEVGVRVGLVRFVVAPLFEDVAARVVGVRVVGIESDGPTEVAEGPLGVVPRLPHPTAEEVPRREFGVDGQGAFEIAPGPVAPLETALVHAEVGCAAVGERFRIVGGDGEGRVEVGDRFVVGVVFEVGHPARPQQLGVVGVVFQRRGEVGDGLLVPLEGEVRVAALGPRCDLGGIGEDRFPVFGRPEAGADAIGGIRHRMIS